MQSITGCLFYSFESMQTLLVAPLLSAVAVFSEQTPDSACDFMRSATRTPTPFAAVFAFSVFFPTAYETLVDPTLRVVTIPY